MIHTGRCRVLSMRGFYGSLDRPQSLHPGMTVIRPRGAFPLLAFSYFPHTWDFYDGFYDAFLLMLVYCVSDDTRTFTFPGLRAYNAAMARVRSRSSSKSGLGARTRRDTPKLSIHQRRASLSSTVALTVHQRRPQVPMRWFSDTCRGTGKNLH